MQVMLRDFCLVLAVAFSVCGLSLLYDGIATSSMEASALVIFGGALVSLGLTVSCFAYKMHASRPQGQRATASRL